MQCVGCGVWDVQYLPGHWMLIYKMPGKIYVVKTCETLEA